MEKSSWVISETMDFQQAPTTESMSRKAKKAAMARVAPAAGTRTSVKRRRKTKELTGASYVIMATLVVFVIGLSLLFQLTIMSQLNQGVNHAQEELREANALNDSKEGQLMLTADLTAIEATARSYGMTDANSSQYVYESVDTLSKEAAEGEKQQGLFGGLFK